MDNNNTNYVETVAVPINGVSELHKRNFKG